MLDTTKGVTLRKYVREILKSATYKPCEDSECIIAFVEVLPGCMTQGETFEDARELLIDAIELWILSALKDNDALPVVNGCKLAVAEPPEAEAVNEGEDNEAR